jgi:hypothetical protein
MSNKVQCAGKRLEMSSEEVLYICYEVDSQIDNDNWGIGVRRIEFENINSTTSPALQAISLLSHALPDILFQRP